MRAGEISEAKVRGWAKEAAAGSDVETLKRRGQRRPGPRTVSTRVRHASPADANQLARLLTDFNTEFGATGDAPDGAAGFALVVLRPSPYYDEPVASLDELYVHPALRGRGIGSKQIAALPTHARAEGWGEIQINVDEPDDGSRRFYESHGFTNTEPGGEERMLCYLMELEG